MARLFEFVSLSENDGSVQRAYKLNWNFQKISDYLSGVNGSATASVDVDVDAIVNEVVDSVWPVGSVIMCKSTSDPRLRLGTWRRISEWDDAIIKASSAAGVVTAGVEVAVSGDEVSALPQTVSILVYERIS